MDSTNTHRKNSQSVRNHRRHRQRKSSIRRCRDSITKRNNQLSPTQINVDTELSKDEELRIQQRAMYNARQTLFIPLITDIDFSPYLLESPDEQNDLLTDILTLLNNSNEECSFFGQFSI